MAVTQRGLFIKYRNIKLQQLFLGWPLLGPVQEELALHIAAILVKLQHDRSD